MEEEEVVGGERKAGRMMFWQNYGWRNRRSAAGRSQVCLHRSWFERVPSQRAHMCVNSPATCCLRTGDMRADALSWKRSGALSVNPSTSPPLRSNTHKNKNNTNEAAGGSSFMCSSSALLLSGCRSGGGSDALRCESVAVDCLCYRRAPRQPLQPPPTARCD